MARYRVYDDSLDNLAGIWKNYIENGSHFVRFDAASVVSGVATADMRGDFYILEEAGTTFANPSDELGVALTLGTTAGSDVGIVTERAFRPDRDPHMYGRGTPPSVTGQEFTFGFNGQVTTNPFATPTNGIYFYSTGTGVIQAITRNGGTETANNTSVTPDGATEYTFRIEVSGSGTSVAFYINDTLEATNTSNIPTITTALNAAFGGQSGGTSDVMYIASCVAFDTSA